jgi:D-alanine-D-alanine ligase
MQRTTVLLLFGGESSEHDVSISSARNVYAAIDNEKYEVLLGYIDRKGKWWLIPRMNETIATHGAAQIVPVLGTASFVTIPNNRVLKPDVLLPILHGKNGEDGTVQALAQLLHIPIVGCDMTASALCMDKVATKEVLLTHSIPVVPYEMHRSGEDMPDFNQLGLKLGSPMFVKPARAGSSVGVSKVFSEEELEQALKLAHEHDAVALIERGINARELEIAVLGNPPQHQVSSVGEIRSGEEFYSYDAKYATTSASEVDIPADIKQEEAESLRALASKVFTILGCRGLARIDFFMDENRTIYVNEVNTLPGFTNISMYPKLWRHDGITYSQLIEALISSALGATKVTNEPEEVKWS